jgi:OOP family OmpA-OmpF porin
MRQRTIWPAVMPALLSISIYCAAQAPAPATPRPGQVLVNGAVPDEASKAALLARVRELYGAERVVDQLSISPVSLPPNWNGYVQKLVGPNLKLISKGEIKIDGTNITLRGEVANEAQRQQIASDFATSLNPTYTVNNGLRVSAAEQNLLDDTLAKRIIEFESGKAALTDSGKAILDEMAAALQKVKGKKVEVIGHTDNVGLRDSNLALSHARAQAVRSYLADRGISQDMVMVSGQGPDRPVAENSSADGRARNRRIEFRIAQ